jgi:hypothetical protein
MDKHKRGTKNKFSTLNTKNNDLSKRNSEGTYSPSHHISENRTCGLGKQISQINL